MLDSLHRFWQSDESFLKLCKSLEKSTKSSHQLTGLESSALALFCAALVSYLRRPALYVCRDAARAEKAYTDLHSFAPPGTVGLLPARDLYFGGDILARGSETSLQRAANLSRLRVGKNAILVATASSIASRTLPPAVWDRLTFSLEASGLVNRDELLRQLSASGYERLGLVERHGQFSARGDVVDIFPANMDLPVRLDLFDEKICSLRSFDPATQRSNGALSAVTIGPAFELVLDCERFKRGAGEIKAHLAASLRRLKKSNESKTAARLDSTIQKQLESLALPGGLEKQYSYFSYFFGEGASALHYLSPGSLLFIDEPDAVFQAWEAASADLADYQGAAALEGALLASPLPLQWADKELIGKLELNVLNLTLFPPAVKAPARRPVYNFDINLAPYYHGRFDLAAADLVGWSGKGCSIYIAAEKRDRARELSSMLQEKEVFNGNEAGPAAMAHLPFAVTTLEGQPAEGIVAPGLGLVLLTEANLLPRRPRKKRIAGGENPRLKDYRELNAGDYIVHETHGIGRYQGLVTMEINGVMRDYMLLKYRGADKLYIPAEQSGMIQKYSGGEEKSLRLSSLGGAEWRRLKTRVKRSVEDMAQELLSLYAARKAVEGYRYGPDHPWQRDFEAQFPFEETADQLKAVDEVKIDLEKPYPMDRLICGDVGYGKTEVALRAAFKASMEGKQTALLVPTTILAEQHYRTFCERFKDFPVKVARMSRFLSPAGQKEVAASLSSGRIDIVIGTHRLFSKDVSFSDLGLLIIDEEHRFGVRHKEKIRQMRLEVDTLAMTATPIPRTLHLSLAGARDMSIIETPPENRYPVQTYVLEYTENVIYEAIRRELQRGGQVFFVYNRIERIERFTGKLRLHFPDAKITFGHGRMPEAELERVMAAFQKGEYSILVSTTIIEAGLDIPNVNTLVVYDADRFGLAQLYQLRGRVGRSERLAYAYLTYRKNKLLSEAAQKRLRAIKEFTELGSGFKIALRDLEIRGAGNILGQEQHGFISAVGFDLYTAMLEEAIAAMKGTKAPKVFEPKLELELDAYIPPSYIPGQEEKIEFYRRIYAAEDSGKLASLASEMAERFGAAPPPVSNLFAAAGLRLKARRFGVKAIRQRGFVAEVTLIKESAAKLAGPEAQASIERHGLKVLASDPPCLRLALPGNGEMALSLGRFFAALSQIAEVK